MAANKQWIWVPQRIRIITGGEPSTASPYVTDCGVAVCQEVRGSNLGHLEDTRQRKLT